MKRARCGQVVVESALAVTAMVLLLFGILDFGRAYYMWQTLAVVAREGARWGIVHGSDAGLSKDDAETQGKSWVQSQFGTSLPASSKVSFSWPDGDNDPGDNVRVTIQSDFEPATPLMGKKIKLQGVSEMRIIR